MKTDGVYKSAVRYFDSLWLGTQKSAQVRYKPSFRTLSHGFDTLGQALDLDDLTEEQGDVDSLPVASGIHIKRINFREKISLSIRPS